MFVLRRLGRNSDIAVPADAPCRLAKYAATLSMSAGDSCAAIAFMRGFLRAPDLKPVSWLPRYPAFWPARLGMAALTLTPLTPWQAAQTSLALALPASMSFAWASDAQASTAIVTMANLSMKSLLFVRLRSRPDGAAS